MSHCGCEPAGTNGLERKTLWVLLSINLVMFGVESITGWLAESTGLLADSLDMLADALVYGVSLYAVGRSSTVKTNSAITSGVLQIGLGVGVIADVIRRAVMGSEPEGTLMLVISVIALTANVSCLLLIAKHREGGVHMRAAWIFSTNDVIANLGVILSGLLVMSLGSRLPDLIIGTLISGVVVKGGIRILHEASQAKKKSLIERDRDATVTAEGRG